MALMDFIKEPASKVLPTEEDIIRETEKQQEQSTSPAQPSQPDGQDVSEEAALKAPVADTSGVKRPEWMSEEEYKEASKVFTPERIGQLYNDFDPKSADTIYETLYKATHKEPTIPDEKKAKAARTMAGVVDALSVLVQGISGAKGAYIPRMNHKSALETVAKEQQRLGELYKADRDRYNAGLYQSTLADLEAARRGYSADRNALLGLLSSIRSQNAAKALKSAELAYKQEKDKLDREEKKKEAAATADYRNKQLDVSRMNAMANMARANNSSESAKKKGEIEFFDPNTSSTYTIDEKKFKANAPQMFLLLRDEIFASDENLKKRYNSSKGKISLQEQEDAVKKYMYDNPEAMALLGNISKRVDRDPTHKLTNDHIQNITNMIERSEGDDVSAKRDIASYLMSEGFSKDDIKDILRKMEE